MKNFASRNIDTFIFTHVSFSYRSTPLTVPDEAPPSKKARIDMFAELRDGSASDSNESTSTQLSGRGELARYKALRVPAKHRTPLMFWREYAQEFPLLSEVARRVLCISASSAQSERDCSAVGHTITDVRSRLSPTKVEAVEIVHWGHRSGLVDTV
jgi:hAT family C-terminal dimerisation region